MANVKVNLTEELISDVTSAYNEFKDNLSSVFSDVRNEFETIVEDTHYDALVKLINQFIGEFQGDVKTAADTTFQEWLDGDGNYHSAMELQQAGDDAISAASDFENQLKTAFDELWSTNPFGEDISTDTSHPTMKEEHYDELERIFTEAYTKFDDAINQAVNNIEGKSQDDPSYSTSLPAFYSMSKSIINAVDAARGKVDKFKQDNEGLTSQQEQNAQNAVQEAINNSVRTEDVASALEMFNGSF